MVTFMKTRLKGKGIRETRIREKKEGKTEDKVNDK